MHAFGRQIDGRTDGRTDRQTDRILIARPRLHYMQRGKKLYSVFSGVATGWTGVDMSTPLLPEVIPEIDANPMTFLAARRGWGASVSGLVWHLKFMG